MVIKKKNIKVKLLVQNVIVATVIVVIPGRNQHLKKAD